MKNILNVILSFLDYITHIFPVKNNRIICSNFNGRKYDGNSKYFCEMLKEHYSNMEIYCLSKSNSFSNGIHYVKFPSIRALYYFSTSKIWVSNVRLPIWISKKKNQVYVQVWHGRGSFKKIEKLAGTALDNNYIKTAKKDSKQIDLLISPDRFDTNLLKKCFWYDGKIIEYDLSYGAKQKCKQKQKEISKKLRKTYGIKDNEKIVLYAPTFRKYNYDYSINMENINSNYKLFIKLHPGIKNLDIKMNNAINVSDFASLDELLVGCDVLISDYSSIVYDYLFYNKEVYLYAPDYKDYAGERGFYVDYENMPFSISYNIEELEKNINNQEYKKYEKKLDKYLKDNGFNKDNTMNLKKIFDFLDDKII